MRISSLKILLVLTSLFLGACSSTDKTQEDVLTNHPDDPFESVNRDLWHFNWEVLDKNVLRPVAVAYVDNVPAPMRTGLYNMAENLDEPSSAVSNILQGKIVNAFSDLGRFGINSTLGVVGIFDVAKHFGLERKQEDMSEALGAWGVGTGPYLMLPGMGPSDPRSIVGDVADSAYFPLDSLNIYTSVFRSAIKALEARGQLMQQEQLVYDSLDSYVLVRDIYWQSEESAINDGEVSLEEDEEELDEFLDEID